MSRVRYDVRVTRGHCPTCSRPLPTHQVQVPLDAPRKPAEHPNRSRWVLLEQANGLRVRLRYDAGS